MSTYVHNDDRIRVLIADDHMMVRSGLSAFLQTAPDLELVGEAACGEDAIRMSADLHPDVVLMDLIMPGMDGVSAISAIHGCQPEVRIIALTSFPEEDLVQKALRAGALSYLLKNISAADLATAIREARAGRSTLAPEATQALVRQASRPETPGKDLSGRECEVLSLMVQGMSNRLIADRLFISRSTVDFHVSNILGKLNASTRTEAVALAVTHGLVDLQTS